MKKIARLMSVAVGIALSTGVVLADDIRIKDVSALPESSQAFLKTFWCKIFSS